MAYGAIDLHSTQSQVRIVTDAGEIVDRRIATTRDQFARLFPPDPPMRVLLEASTESEWVAQCLEAGGHEVIVADPNYAPMYGHRTRRIKTDRRDVAALADACRLQLYRPAHRTSATQRAVRRHLHVRRQLVRTRSRAISVLRTMLRSEGLRLAGGVAETVPTRLAALTLPHARGGGGPRGGAPPPPQHGHHDRRRPARHPRHDGSRRHPADDRAGYRAGDGHHLCRRPR